jgi:hypothetical protein
MTSGDNDKKGFGAFADLVSDVSKEIETPVQTPAPATEPVKVTVTPQPQNSSHPSQPQQPTPAKVPQNTTGGSKGGTPWWWIAFGVFVIFAIIEGSEEKSVVYPAAPASTYQETYPPSATSTEEPVQVPRDPKNPEEMPPVGTDLVFSHNQIRYCLSMDVRLGTIKDALDNHSQTEVDNFNSSIEDYNSRCSKFRYRRGSLESVRSEVTLNHPTLVTEGLKTLESWRGADSHPKKSKHKTDDESDTDLFVPQASNDQSAQNRDTDLKEKTAEEQNSIESVCSGEKLLNGPAAYYKCLASQNSKLAMTPSPPDLSALNPDERSSIESVCNGEKLLYGPAAYYKCLTAQKTKLENTSAPDLSSLSIDEQISIKSVCNGEKLLYGPAAYYKCLTAQKTKLENTSAPDLSGLSINEQSSIKSVCNGEKLLYGPAAYYKCLSNQKTQLVSGPSAPDMSHLTADERSSIETVCNGEKLLYGPATYYKCLQSQVRKLH